VFRNKIFWKQEACPLDAASDVGEVKPDFDAAEVGAFGADGRGDAGAEMAGRADVLGEFGMDAAEFRDFVHGGGVDFFLCVEAGAHGPFVEKMEERAGFDEANGFGVGEKIESDFGRDAAGEESVFGGPGVVHGALVHFAGARIFFEELRGDEVGLARVGEGEEGTRAGNHAMALVLRIRGVGDFLCKGVIGVLERAHDGRVDADVERFKAIKVFGGIEEPIDGVGVGALRFGEAEDGAEGIGDDARGVGGVVDELGSSAG